MNQKTARILRKHIRKLIEKGEKFDTKQLKRQYVEAGWVEKTRLHKEWQKV